MNVSLQNVRIFSIFANRVPLFPRVICLKDVFCLQKEREYGTKFSMVNEFVFIYLYKNKRKREL